jgi:SAM-dependent methyltransferase
VLNESKKKLVNLNLGCGDQRLLGYTGLDILVRNGVDVVCDLNNPLPFANSTIDHICTKSLLEHIDNLEGLLAELLRVLKPDGTLYIYVPHWSNPFYYSDYTHRRFSGLVTFDYFANPPQQRFRSVPVYTNLRLKTVSVRLLFQSPFKWLNWLLKACQLIVNINPRTQLFYEYHLSSFIACYALEYKLQNSK